MEHSRRWQLHIGGSKMFEFLFHTGINKWASPIRDFKAGLFREFLFWAGPFPEFFIWCWPIKFFFWESVVFFICFSLSCVSFWPLILLYSDNMHILQKYWFKTFIPNCFVPNCLFWSPEHDWSVGEAGFWVLTSPYYKNTLVQVVSSADRTGWL